MSIIVLLALSGLLLAFTASTYLGYQGTRTQSILELDAHVWLVTKKVEGENYRPRLRGKNIGENLTWLHKNVANVRPIMSPNRMALANVDHYGGAELHAVRLEEGDVTYPKTFPEHFRQVLAVPGHVVLRRSEAEKLGLQVGDQFGVKAWRSQEEPRLLMLGAILEERRDDYRSRIYGSPETIRMTSLNGAADSGSVMAYAVKLHEPQQANRTASELRMLLESQGKLLTAMTAEQMAAETSELATLEDEGGDSLKTQVGIVVSFVLLMTTLIMRTNFLSQLKEFGTLNALGISKMSLAFLMMKQGFWMGLIGGVGAIASFLLVKTVLEPMNIVLTTTTPVMAIIFVLLILISMVSSFASVFVLRKIELTSLLR